MVSIISEEGWKPTGGKLRLSVKIIIPNSELGNGQSPSPTIELEKMCRECPLRREHCTGLHSDASEPETKFNATRSAPNDIPVTLSRTVYPCDEKIGK